MDISIILPSRNNLKYLTWAYSAIRSNQGAHNVQICVADDASFDGTWDWCVQKMHEDLQFNAIRNESGKRLGHTILYDRLVEEVSKYDICMIYHADMYLIPGALDAISNLIEPGTIVSLTRIEPPLHPDGVEKVLLDLGTEPEYFDEGRLLSIFNNGEYPWQEKIPAGKKSEGIFAPWAFYKSDFLRIGGHDPLYRPQSKEDCMAGGSLIFVEIDGFKKYITVEELWSLYGAESSVRRDSKECINLKKHKIKVLSPTPNGKIGLKKVEGVIRKKVPTSRLREVRTQWGMVVVTDDHSLITEDLQAIKASDLNNDINLWEPIRFYKDSIRRNLLESVDFNKYLLIEGGINYQVASVADIDKHGNNFQLIDICEFLGYYVAEGGTHFDLERTSYSISMSCNNLEQLTYFKEKSISLFKGDIWSKPIINKKENCEDVYRIASSSKQLAGLLINLVGGNSHTKKVPDFIYNVPKVYQEAFLYGYLVGDGYLGTSINRQKNQTSFSVPKKLFFDEKLFRELTWKSTSASDLLTAGINYLLKKCFPGLKTRISFRPNKGSEGVYTLDTCKFYKSKIMQVQDYKSEFEEEYVYDLEVRDTHMFIGGTGLVALHNSDIFNRFHISGIKFIQTWEGYVYHMTSRGSRFNPTITEVGRNSDEWVAQNIRSEKNFRRKWGSTIKHDNYLKPIVPPKYKVTVVMSGEPSYNLIETVEPLCSYLYIQKSLINEYIQKEQPNTDYNLSERVLDSTTFDYNKAEGVVVYINSSAFTAQDFMAFLELSVILQEQGTLGDFELLNMKVSVKDLKSYEDENVLVTKK